MGRLPKKKSEIPATKGAESASLPEWDKREADFNEHVLGLVRESPLKAKRGAKLLASTFVTIAEGIETLRYAVRGGGISGREALDQIVKLAQAQSKIGSQLKISDAVEEEEL